MYRASGIATNINSIFLSFKASCLPSDISHPSGHFSDTQDCEMPTRPPLPVEEPSILTRAAKVIE
jgi:hypothetical protein